MSTAQSAAIFCDRKSTNARAVFKQWGFDLAADPENADLLWMRDAYASARYHLAEHQVINHLPAERVLVDKGHLTRSLKQFDRTQLRYDFSLRDFYQDTYRLYEDQDCRAFLAQLPQPDRRDNLWILKPTDASSGKGVQVMWQFEQLRELYYTEPESTFQWIIGGDRRYIAQRYITDPLLLLGRKSEIRVYWMIASLNPLLVLLYQEGTARLNSQPFRLEDFDNTLVHVTNIYQQKHHPDYDPALDLKWSFARLQSYLCDELGMVGPDFIDNQLRPQLNERLAFVVSATIESLAAAPAPQRFFGVYGADFILDSQLRPWLAEVQLGPGLSLDSDLKRRVIPGMLGGAVRLELEVRQRRRSGATLRHLDRMHGFEWVMNRA